MADDNDDDDGVVMEDTTTEEAREQKTTEPSFQQAFAALWKDEKFHDVTLKANDGVSITANRATLAARSDVFDGMLFGKFSEASRNVISIGGFNSGVLRSVIEYIYTDHAQVFDVNLDITGRLQTLVVLAGAANYFNLPLLCHKACLSIAETLEKSPSLAVVVLEACAKEGPSVPKLLMDAVLYSLRFNHFNLKDDSAAVRSLCPSALKEILRDDQTLMHEFELFALLRHWAMENNLEEQDTTTAPRNGGSIKLNAERKPIALTLVKYIRLDRIAPAVLADTVSFSGLVSNEQLLEAFQYQARSSKGQVFQPQPRFTPVWKSSGDLISIADNLSTRNRASVVIAEGNDYRFEHGIDYVQYPHPIKSGVHQWCLQPVGGEHGWSLGIILAHSKPTDVKSFFRDNNGSWFYNSDGSTNGVERGRPGFVSGVKLTFTLDLLPNRPGNGTLSVATDDGTPHSLFSDLRGHLYKNDTRGGFLPAIQTSRGSIGKPSVHLLGTRII